MLSYEEFRKGEFDTGFIDRWLRERNVREPASETQRDLALIAAALAEAKQAPAVPKAGLSDTSQWKASGRIRGLRR